MARRQLRGYPQLVLVRGAGLWSRSSVYFLVMLLIIGLMARKKEERQAVLWTAGIAISIITLDADAYESRLLPVAASCTLYTVSYVYESQTARLIGSVLTLGFVGHKWWVKGLPRVLMSDR